MKIKVKGNMDNQGGRWWEREEEEMKKGNNAGGGGGGKLYHNKPRTLREREERQGRGGNAERERLERRTTETQCGAGVGWRGQVQKLQQRLPSLAGSDGASGGNGCRWRRRKQEGHRCV